MFGRCSSKGSSLLYLLHQSMFYVSATFLGHTKDYLASYS